MNKTLYELLQVSPSADIEVIDAAYARLRQTHDGNEVISKAIKVAYDTLSNPLRRANYDQRFISRMPSRAGHRRADGRRSRYGEPDAPALLPQIRSGKMRVLAVASERCSRVLPQVPTKAESGMPSYHASSWHGLFAPAGTPREIVTRLHTEFVRIVKLPDITERLYAQGVEPVASTPGELAEFVKSEIAR